jgi:polar amino acid transport system ATP-binding protein
MTMVVVTHDIGFARESADRVAFLSQGEVCELGTASQVIDNPFQEQTRRFLRRENRTSADCSRKISAA